MCFTPGMTSRIAILLTTLILAFAPATFAGSKRDSKISATFHMETDQNEDQKMIFSQMANGKVRFFRRSPEISTKDVVAFSPFPAEGADGYGMVFQLSGMGKHRLTATTSANVGRVLLAQINGRVVDGVIIDKVIDDGFLVVWKGITLNDVKAFDDAMPRIGRSGKQNKK